MFLWRKIAESIVLPVTYLVNKMLQTSEFPTILKKGQLTPIFKRGDANKPENYRPITNLHNLSKVFERIILNRIDYFCENQNLLPKSQFGFRTGYSTKDAILQIEKNLLTKTGIFLDLSKAFDMVEHHTLLNTLDSLGFRGHFHALLKNYLSNRIFSIKNSDREFRLEGVYHKEVF